MTTQESVALRSPAAWVTFVAALGAGLAADLWSKWAVFHWLIPTYPESAAAIPGVLRFTLSTNSGIVFGLQVPPIAVLTATVFAIGAVVYFFAGSARNARPTHAALGMVLAGALGNLYDRLFSLVQLPGQPVAVRQVRDFIEIGIGSIRYPWVFNLADALLVVGMAILILGWKTQPREGKPKGGK